MQATLLIQGAHADAYFSRVILSTSCIAPCHHNSYNFSVIHWSVEDRASSSAWQLAATILGQLCWASAFFQLCEHLRQATDECKDC